MLENKLKERTAFISSTPYSMDSFETSSSGKNILKKGTADQLDKMFANTDKINKLVQDAMNALAASSGSGGSAKGGGLESLGDSDKSF